MDATFCVCECPIQLNNFGIFGAEHQLQGAEPLRSKFFSFDLIFVPKKSEFNVLSTNFIITWNNELNVI